MGISTGLLIFFQIGHWWGTGHLSITPQSATALSTRGNNYLPFSTPQCQQNADLKIAKPDPTYTDNPMTRFDNTTPRQTNTNGSNPQSNATFTTTISQIQPVKNNNIKSPSAKPKQTKQNKTKDQLQNFWNNQSQRHGGVTKNPQTTTSHVAPQGIQNSPSYPNQRLLPAVVIGAATSEAKGQRTFTQNPNQVALNNTQTSEEQRSIDQWIEYLVTEKSLKASQELYRSFKNGELTSHEFIAIINHLIHRNDPVLFNLARYLLILEISPRIFPYLFEMKNHTIFKHQWPFFIQLYRSQSGLHSYLQLLSNGALTTENRYDLAEFVLAEIRLLLEQNTSWIYPLLTRKGNHEPNQRGQWHQGHNPQENRLQYSINQIQLQLRHLIQKNPSSNLAEQSQKILEILDREVLAFHPQE